jgi:Skp family chaperone for outer membrane proteins
MSDEAQAPVEQNAEVANMQAELDAMRRKNSELLDEYKKAIAQAKAVPDGVNVDELLEFKRNYEQQQLESQGKYSEARQALEQQFREATAEKDQRISQLEARVRELELVTPAVTALAEIVHDPDMVLIAATALI